MVLSCNINSIRTIVGEEKAVAMLAEAGFDAIDYSLGDLACPYGPWEESNYRERAKRLLGFAGDHGVYFNQAHAPFALSTTGQLTDDVLKNIDHIRLKRVFEVCGLLNIPHVIVHGLAHPSIASPPQKKFDANIAYFRKLKELAEPYGVRIALENLFKTFSSPESYANILDALNDDYFLACVDVGHCYIVNGGTETMIRRLGSRVQALHIHDNHYEYDEHLIPGTGSLDWNSTLAALSDIGYSGDFTFELAGHACSCMTQGMGFGADFLHSALRFAERSGRHLAEKLARMLQR